MAANRSSFFSSPWKPCGKALGSGKLFRAVVLPPNLPGSECHQCPVCAAVSAVFF